MGEERRIERLLTSFFLILWISQECASQNYCLRELFMLRGCVCYASVVNCVYLNLTRIPSELKLNAAGGENGTEAGRFSDTQVLDLRFNKIRHIPPECMSGLGALHTLLLNNNNVRRLRSGSFSGLGNLKYLYLYKNHINYIESGTFRGLEGLEHLYLHFNFIHELPPNLLHGLGSLQGLFLHHNKIRNLPGDVFDRLRSLEKIRLDGNPLECNCDWIGALVAVSNVTAACVNDEGSENDVERISCGNEEKEKGGRLVGLRFTLEPSDSAVDEGGTLTLSCRTNVDSVLSWTKDGVTISDGSTRQRRKSVYTLSSRSSTLRISPTRNGDAGRYRCLASASGRSLLSHSAKVTVASTSESSSSSRFFKPTITNRPDTTEVTKGDVIRLPCGATGFPKPTFAWFKDGGRLSNAHDRFKITSDGTLEIENAQLDDSAHYRCSATNYLGRASSAARVRVNLAEQEAKPQFTTRPRPMNRARESGIVELTCVASGHPYPDYSWWKDNRIVNSDGRVTVSNGGQHLRIQDVRVRDAGDYICRAENSLGREEATATLEVTSLARGITMTQEPHDMQAPTGATVQMPCSAQGNPKPRIYWMRNGQVLDAEDSQDARHFRVTSTGSLVVYNVSRADAGMYECVAENERERRTASAQFRIRGEAPSIAPTDLDDRTRYETAAAESAVIAATENDVVLVALEEASRAVDAALNATVQRLFSPSSHSKGENASNTPAELLRIFRYPPESQRELARAAEIYERTLDLVAEKLSSEGVESSAADFSYSDLISATNLELIANLSGCEAHRRRLEAKSECEEDLCFQSKFRTFDGTCNNFARPLQGASLTAFRRLLAPQYENGFNTPIGWDPSKLYNGLPKPSARHISNRLIATSKVSADASVSHMAMQWGQFLDHDVSHSMESISRQTFFNGAVGQDSEEPSACGATCDNRAPCFPIQIPDDDPRVSSSRCMEFTRSSAACGSGATSVFFDRVQTREQVNQLTAYIDASQVYGSDPDLGSHLRNLTNDLGRMREGPSFGYGKPLLPFNNGLPVDCRRDPRESNIGCFLAGDVRANEQLGLLALHTVWLREHNRVAGALRRLNPHWDGDRLFHEARKVVGAQMQHITFAHWLPTIIGHEGMRDIGPYKGYNASEDASVSNVFAASAFRFGHTMINPELRRLGPDFSPIAEGNLPLRKAFFSPWRLVQEGGVDPILRGLFATPAKQYSPDEVMNEELTERLFEVAHAVALDLAAVNIQRGRDHGLPSYADYREWCGFGETHSWHDLSHHIRNQEVLHRLSGVYGHPGNVDVWVGGLMEEPVAGSKVGPTVRCLLVEQFRRFRDGDRFWYENPSTFCPAQLAQIRASSLSSVMCDNGDGLGRATRDAFRVSSGAEGEEGTVLCEEIPRMALQPWFECEDEERLVSRPRRQNNRDTSSLLP